MKKTFLLLLFLALVAITPAKAFLVTIPDANFRARLQTLYPTCFVSGQMETTCTGITSAISLVVNGLNIANLSGVEYFTSLQILWCRTNQLTSLPALPASLRNLLCDTNQLTSLPALPTSLQFLACFSNQLTSLPALPASLQNLDCAFNQLASLPALSASLQNLNCVANQLTSLPALPASLQLLDCYSNQLTSLPALPASLQRLACENNQLTNLPALPTSLQNLRCQNNLLDFADLEAINPTPVTYQATPQGYNILPATQSLVVGGALSINGVIGGSLNVYQWYKNSAPIPSATSATYTKTNITSADAGTYYCEVTSTYVGAGTTTGVTITSSNVVVTVLACPTITISPNTANLPASVVGTFYSQTITQTGLTGTPTWSVISGNLPNGVSITPSTGVISGTPTNASNFTFTVSVTDGTCTQTRVYTIVVTCPPIVFTNTTSNVGATVGTFLSFNGGVTGNTSTVVYSVSPALPLGLNLNTATGVITGTPTTAISGFLDCTITATQGNCSVTRIYTFFVSCPITTFTISLYTNAIVGTVYSFYISADVSGNTQPVTYTVSPTLPTGFNLNSTTGLISGTPTALTASATYTVRATQGTCFVTNTYTFSVLCPPLTFTSAAVTNGTVGATYTLDGSVTSSVGVVYSVSPTLPAGLGINTATGEISGTPTAAATLTTYTVTATKGTCTATRGYAFSIACPPIAFTNSTVTNSTVGTFYFLDASVSGNNLAVIYSVSPTLPAGLNINTSNGTISGTPTTATASGTYTVTAAQGTCTATRAYTFLVACAGISINNASLPNGTIGATYNQTLTQTGLVGTPIWSLSTGNTLPAGLILASGTGVISGTPTSVASSTFTITVTAGACSQARTYTIITACPNIVFTNTTANLAIINTPYSLSAGVTGNNETITYSILPTLLPIGLTFNTTTGLISGTPTAITPSATYIVTASQSAGTCVVTQGYTFAVTNCLPFSILPSTNTNALPDGNVGIPYLGVTFTVANAPAGATYTFTQVSGVSLTTLGLSLNTATGTISGTPTSSSAINIVIVATNNATGCPSTPKSYTVVIYPNPATSIDNSLDNVVKVSPNPSSNDFNVNFGNLNMTKSLVRVYDAQGKVVFTSENNANLMTISLGDFANGIYMLEVQTEKGRVIKRLAKTN